MDLTVDEETLPTEADFLLLRQVMDIGTMVIFPSGHRVSIFISFLEISTIVLLNLAFSCLAL